jgi:hypothetical protein
MPIIGAFTKITGITGIANGFFAKSFWWQTGSGRAIDPADTRERHFRYFNILAT